MMNEQFKAEIHALMPLDRVKDLIDIFVNTALEFGGTLGVKKTPKLMTYLLIEAHVIPAAPKTLKAAAKQEVLRAASSDFTQLELHADFRTEADLKHFRGRYVSWITAREEVAYLDHHPDQVPETKAVFARKRTLDTAPS